MAATATAATAVAADAVPVATVAATAEPGATATPVTAGTVPVTASAKQRLQAAASALLQAEKKVGVRSHEEALRHGSMWGSTALAPVTGVHSAAVGVLRESAELLSDFDVLMRQARTRGACQIDGSRTLLLAVAAAQQGRDGWCITVGDDGFGWAAAQWLGLSLERCVIIDPLPEQGVASVLASAIDGADVVLMSPSCAAAVPAREQRQLAGRSRRRHSLLVTEAPWAGGYRLSASAAPVLQADPQGAYEMAYLPELSWECQAARGGGQTLTVTCGSDGVERGARQRRNGLALRTLGGDAGAHKGMRAYEHAPLAG